MRPKPYKKAKLPPLTVEEQKAELVIKVMSLKDESLVQTFTEFFDELTTAPVKRVSIEQYNKEIDEAVKRVESGKFISHEDVMREMEEW